MVSAFFFSAKGDTALSFIPFDFITRIMFAKDYKSSSTSSSYFLQLRFSSSLSGTNIFSTNR
jgi:hypothetical protein